MNNALPRVSIIIPVYNVADYLRQCLDSIVNQTLKEIEIICINDGSTDSSPQILEEYAQKDARIRIISRENKGLSTDIMLSKLLEIETTQQILADKINLCSNNLFSVKNELPLLENKLSATENKLLLAEKVNSDELQQIDNLHRQFLQHAEQLQNISGKI